MGSHYVYAHIDPETEVPFYIGMGQGKRDFDKSKRHGYWLRFVEKYTKDYQVKYIAEGVDQESDPGG